MLILGGHVPVDVDGGVVFGRLGDDLDLSAGRSAARLAALSALSTILDALNRLEQVARILHLRGLVNATPEFTGHTQVIDGASELFLDVLGDAGRHARLAVGVASLPGNIALEIELMVALAQSDDVQDEWDSAQ